MTSLSSIPCIEGDRGPALLGVRAVFEALAIILVVLRIFTRARFVPSGFGWDDITIVVAMILLIPGYGLTVRMVDYGLGQHIGCIIPTELIRLTKFLIIGEVLILFSTLISRISICWFLLRLFTVNISWRWTLYGIMATTTVTNVILAATNLSQCEPRAKLWNRTLPGECWDSQVILGLAYWQGATSVILDLILSGFPIYCLRKIQMSSKIKAAICGIMSLGVFTACACLVRTILSDRIISKDFTWDVVEPTIWGHVEAEIAICAACIPTLRPLFTRKSKNSTRSSYTNFSGTGRGVATWPRNHTSDTSGSYGTNVTSRPREGDDISLEKMYGIRKVVDVHVSV